MSEETTPIAAATVPSETTGKAKQSLLPKLPVKRQTALIAGIILLLALLGGGLYRYRGLFVAATVNGAPISRLSVIQDLEKQSGKAALDNLIAKKLIRDAAKGKGIAVTPADIDGEMKKIEAQVTGQGGTLDDALAQQGITRDLLTDQITVRKELEGVLADQTAVSDQEIQDYVAKNKLTAPKGTDPSVFTDQIRQQLSQQKFSTAADQWITSAKAAAHIQYFVAY